MKGLGEINSHFRYLRKRSRTTYITSLISISLVLFFIGIFTTAVIFGRAFAKYAQESIYFKVFLHDGIDTDRQQQFIAELEQAPFAKEVIFVSKEEAGQIMLQRTGEDVLKLTEGVNPFLASLNLRLEPIYIDNDSLQKIKSDLENEVIVADVTYPVEMISAMRRNVGIISLVGLIVGVVLVGVVLYIIFGTIRLSIYAQRLTIRSMQLIGATNGFVRKPFVLNGLLQGALSGILACVLLGMALWLIGQRLRQFDIQTPLTGGGEHSIFQMMGGSYIGLLLGIVLFGTCLGFLGSWVAVNRYLNRNLDELM